MSNSLTPKHATVLADRLLSLATEIDLHYDDDELLGVELDLARLMRGAELLGSIEGKIPEAVTHVIRRYRTASGDEAGRQVYHS